MTLSPQICSTCQTSNPPQAAFCFGCGQALKPATSDPAILHQRYHLLHQLGAGGFGSVYQAEDIQLGKRLVAVKEMSTRTQMSAQEYAEAEEAFKKEALLLADLMHPNLPRIYDHFSEAGRWYLVMDYIDGVTLEEYLAQMPRHSVPLSEALDMGLQICDVLDYLHTRQPPIIFRDLKPLNIMRNASGHLYLIDFGIARHFKPGQTRDTVAFGSPGYAAPEQYGKTQTTPRSDIYSLGAVLHQMLSGVDPSLSPFRFAPLRLPAGKPTPRALALLLEHMLEMDEMRRPASMHAVKAELQTIATSVASGTFVSIPPLPPPPAPISTSAPVSAAAPTMLARGDLRSRHDRGQGASILAWAPDSTHIASISDTHAIEIWNAATGKTHFTSPQHSSGLRALAWSPDGQFIASAGEDREIHVWSVKTGTTACVYRAHSHTITGLAWSPDSQCIASCSLDKSVQVWRYDNCYCYVNYRRHRDVVYCVSWSPDGQWIASTGYDGSIHIWQAMSGTLAATYPAQAGQILELVWSPDGTLLATGGTSGLLQVWQPMSGDLQHTYNLADKQMRSLSWSPDSTHIASSSGGNHVLIWNLTSDQQEFTYSGHASLPEPPRSTLLNSSSPPSPRIVRAVAWSPDGNWIVSSDTRGTMLVWSAK